MTRTRIFVYSTLLFSAVFSGGYYVGQTISTKQFEKKLSDPKYAMSVILSKQNTWRTQFHEANNTNGRNGAFVSIFKPRFTGAITFVAFKNTTNDKTYILQTIQARVVDGKEMTVCETPAGYYNGAYLSSIPHAVAENAERNIQKQFKLGKPMAHSLAYNEAMRKFNEGHLPVQGYTEDKNLWETSFREVKEETGLDIEKLKLDPSFIITQHLHSEIDIPEEYNSVRLINVSGPNMPVLERLIGDEVISAEWVPLENFDLETKLVSTSKGSFAIKPFVLKSTESVVNEMRFNSQKVSIENSKKLTRKLDKQ